MITFSWPQLLSSQTSALPMNPAAQVTRIFPVSNVAMLIVAPLVYSCYGVDASVIECCYVGSCTRLSSKTQIDPSLQPTMVRISSA